MCRPVALNVNDCQLTVFWVVSVGLLEATEFFEQFREQIYRLSRVVQRSTARHRFA